MSILAGWLFGQVMAAGLDARRLEPLAAALQATLARWRDALPPEYQDQDYWHELFTSPREDPSQPNVWRQALASALRARVPTADEWFQALRERWRSAHSELGSVAFFRQDESVATPYIRALARDMHLTCAKDPALALPTLLARDPLHAPASALVAYIVRGRLGSRARLIAGWQAAGVSEADATSFADEVSVGPIPDGAIPGRRRLTLLVGELGVGKSVVMERLLAEHAAIALRSDDPVAPVTLRTRSVVELGLERAVETETRGLVRPGHAAIFIEDIDALGSDAACDLLADARAFVHLHARASLIATCRPGYIERLAPEATVWVPPLEDDAAIALIARVAGCTTLDARIMVGHRFHEEARRPLFAILLGMYWRDISDQPRSLGELISHLVDTALQRGVPHLDDCADVLLQLAAVTLDRGGPAGVSEVAGLVHSRLITQSRLVIVNGDTVEFALPLLAQWFGAQALARGIRTGEQLTHDGGRLERWRTSLTIAAATLGHETVTPILASVAKARPALVAVVVRDAVLAWGEAESAELLDPAECGRRIREAMRAWVDALGPTADLCAPAPAGQPLPALCVAGARDWLDAGWYYGSNAPADVFRLSEYPHLRPDRLRGSRPARQPAWAWRWTLEELADTLKDVLKARALPSDTGPLCDELIWDTALALTHRGELFNSPLPLAELEVALSLLPPEDIREVRALSVTSSAVSALKRAGKQMLASPWPGPDLVLRSATGLPWHLYSPERLLEKVAAVYRAALLEYPRIVERWFPSLRARMPMAVTLPARLLGEIAPPPPWSEATREPWLSWSLESLARDARSEAAIVLASSDAGLSPSDEEGTRELERLTSMRPEGRGWISITFHNEALRVYRTTPVADVVYRWLENDLKDAGWLT